MATIHPDHELHHKAAHYEIFQKRNERLVALIKKAHKVNFWHKVKYIFRKCKICKEMEGLI